METEREDSNRERERERERERGTNRQRGYCLTLIQYIVAAMWVSVFVCVVCLILVVAFVGL